MGLQSKIKVVSGMPKAKREKVESLLNESLSGFEVDRRYLAETYCPSPVAENLTDKTVFTRLGLGSALQLHDIVANPMPPETNARPVLVDDWPGRATSFLLYFRVRSVALVQFMKLLRDVLPAILFRMLWVPVFVACFKCRLDISNTITTDLLLVEHVPLAKVNRRKKSDMSAELGEKLQNLEKDWESRNSILLSGLQGDLASRFEAVYSDLVSVLETPQADHEAAVKRCAGILRLYEEMAGLLTNFGPYVSKNSIDVLLNVPFANRRVLFDAVLSLKTCAVGTNCARLLSKGKAAQMDNAESTQEMATLGEAMALKGLRRPVRAL